jgi:hypothetical protein
MDPVTLTHEMIVVLTVLFVTVTLFITEAFRIDLTAILTMLAWGCSANCPDLAISPIPRDCLTALPQTR